MTELQNYRMTVAFDGTEFYGFQSQPVRRTVQDVLESTIESVSGAETRVAGAGRTDAGVHAAGLVVSFRSGWRHPPEELERALNAQLPQDVSVRGVERVAATFHARFSARSREYLYRIYSSAVRVPYLDRYAWRLSEEPDVAWLNAAAAQLVGEADMRAWGTAGPGRTTVRRVMRAAWLTEPGSPGGTPIWQFQIEANGFLRGMVRRIVGTLIRESREGAGPECISEILESRDPARAGAPAPARGLFFWRARYPGEDYEDE